MKGALYDDILFYRRYLSRYTDINIYHISLDDVKDSIPKMVDRSKHCIEFKEDYFE